jgi:hypothetical protein
MSPSGVTGRMPVLLLVVALLLGCSSEGAVIPRSDEPFLYLVLNQRPGGDAGAGVTRALLLKSGSPTYSEYLTASRFEMRGAADGALFDWQDRNRSGPAPVDAHNASLAHGNYELPAAGSGSRLGGQDVTPLARYNVTVEVGGRVLSGSTLVPAGFPLTAERRGDDWLVSWPHVAGAAAYSVEVRGPGAPPAFQTDTFVLIPPPHPAAWTPTTEVVIKALDTNLARYVLDRRVSRSGLDDGFGVFGSLTEARVTIANVAR